jgi:hypothetical protein
MEKKKLKKIIWIYENRIEKHKDINRNKASSVIIVIFLLITILVSLIKDSIFIFLLIPALFFMGFLLPGILFYSFFRVIKNKDKYYNRLIEELDKEGIEIEDEIKLKEFFERYYGIKNFSSWNGEVALLSEKAISYYKKRTAEELSLEEIWDSVERFPDNKDFIFSLENNSGNSSLFIRPQDIEYRKNQKIIQDIDYRRLNRIEEIRAENFNELSVKKKNSMLRILTFISLLIFTFIFRDFFYLLFVFIIFLFLKDIIIKHKEIRNIKKNPELDINVNFFIEELKGTELEIKEEELKYYNLFFERYIKYYMLKYDDYLEYKPRNYFNKEKVSMLDPEELFISVFIFPTYSSFIYESDSSST